MTNNTLPDLEETIDWLKTNQGCLCRCAEDYTDRGRTDPDCEFCSTQEMREAALAHLDSMRWRRPEDELPEEGSTVDVMDPLYGRIPDVVYEDNEWCSEYLAWSGRLTHWRYLDTPGEPHE